jgi:dolichol-phosphate mannosyltransferase
MINGKKIIVVVPAYNVQNQIGSTVSGILGYVDHIVVVDDYGKDKTSEIVKQVQDKRIMLIRNGKNRGVGGATVEGFKKGLELGGDIFVKFDGDGQMDAGRMEDLISPLFDGYDYAKANRFMHPDKLKKMPTVRLIGNFLLTFLTKITSGYWNIFDPQNGYLAVTKQALEAIALDKLHARYFFENDMLINLNINRARVCDVNIPARYGDEKSSLKISKILFSFPGLLVRRFLKRVYKKYILYDFSVIGFFYIVGLALMTFGTLFGAYHWIRSAYSGVVATTGTVMIAVLPIILGFQLFLQAIVLEIQEVKNH